MMRSLLLLIALSLSDAAVAAQGSDDTALEPPEGSLWDRIEDVEGTVPTGEAIEESEELQSARNLENSFIDLVVQEMTPPVNFYRDPVEVLSVDPLHLDRINPAEFDIPVVINDDVIRWMKYFTGPGRKYYQRWLARSTRYRPMMYEKLDAAGLPRDLVYLSMIESGYATHAYSSAAAVGLWQFIAPTGKQYDLRIDWWVDARRDPMQATDAAIGFLGDLYNRYDSWYLSWAAYNGGPGRVSRGISRHGTRDFWELVEHNAFPRETDNYVPKLLAAAIIGKHPDRYGFTDISYQDAMAMDAVTVGPNIGLDVLARCAGITLEEFQTLNPHLRRWALPPDPAEQTIYVPSSTGSTFLASLEKIPPQERLTYHRHKVKSGESLGKIAGKYGTSVDAIQSVNRISNPNRIYVGMELVIPASGAEVPPEALTSTSGGSSRSASTSSPARTNSTQTVTHTVARGEALSTIAETYGVKTSELMRWNQISNANRVYAGQKLTVHTATAQWTTYTVRSGDSLSKIAEANRCTTAQLKSWNNISGSTIYAGQKLKIQR